MKILSSGLVWSGIFKRVVLHFVESAKQVGINDTRRNIPRHYTLHDWTVQCRAFISWTSFVLRIVSISISYLHSIQVCFHFLFCILSLRFIKFLCFDCLYSINFGFTLETRFCLNLQFGSHSLFSSSETCSEKKELSARCDFKYKTFSTGLVE